MWENLMNLRNKKDLRPSSEIASTMKVRLQYLFLSLLEDNTQSHPTRMKYNVYLVFH